MASISSLVSQLVFADEIAYESLRRGIINANSYAEEIASKIAQLKGTPVKTNTIATAIRRLERKLQNTDSLRPDIKLSEIKLNSNLSALTYSQSQLDAEKLAASLADPQLAPEFTVHTKGLEQITLVGTTTAIELIKTNHGDADIAHLTGLGAVSCSFDPKYFSEPNVIHSFTSLLSPYQIDLIEIISTYTELILVVQQAELSAVFEIFEGLLE